MTVETMDATPEQIRFWKDDDHIEYHTRQFEQVYRSTIHLSRFMQSLITKPAGTALDVACGAGANIYHLSELLSGYQWTGVDIAGDVMFPIGRKYFSERLVTPTLIEADFLKLTEAFPDQKFDIVLSTQTLLGIPTYEAALDQLLAVTGGWLFITSLFTEFDVDVKVAATDYTRSIEGEPFYYNVYSLARFRARCEARGCRAFEVQDFNIDLDIQRPDSGGLNTYTTMLDSGKRIQFTGPVHLPWKFVAIRMGQ